MLYNKISSLNVFVLTCCILILDDVTSLRMSANETAFWIERKALIASDLNLMIGHDLILSTDEEVVNDLLMDYKGQEMSDGFQTSNFLPAKHFFEAKFDIERSDVFKIIEKMPKGALLHTHDLSMTSIDFVVSKITYMEDLYMCNTTSNILDFRFFDVPDTTCEWALVADVRLHASSPREFDAFLHSQLSLYTTDPESAYPDVKSVWKAFVNTLTSITGLVKYHKAWAIYLDRALHEMVSDNIVYLEFRGVLDPLYDMDGRIFSDIETFSVYWSVIQNFTSANSDKFFGARFIYAPSRAVDVQQVWGYVNLVNRLKALYPMAIAGFDFSGQEGLGQPLTAFIEPLLNLTQAEPAIPFFFHAGGTNWIGMPTDENLYDALLLNATRIGSGYAITKHPKLMNIAREKDVPVEVIPIPNQVLMLVKDLRNHPATTLATSSFPLIVSSNAQAAWEASPLSHDFYEFFMGIGGARADLRLLKKLALNSIRYSSLDPNEKSLLESMWQDQWNEFISSFQRDSQEWELSDSQEWELSDSQEWELSDSQEWELSDSQE